jgi:hypothetical protein
MRICAICLGRLAWRNGRGASLALAALPLATDPARAQSIDILTGAQPALAGLSALMATVLGVSGVIALVGLWLLVRPQRSARAQAVTAARSPVAIPMPDLRGQPVQGGKAGDTVRLAEAIAAAKARVAIREEERSADE